MFSSLFMLPLFTGHPCWKAPRFPLVLSDFAFCHLTAQCYVKTGGSIHQVNRCNQQEAVIKSQRQVETKAAYEDDEKAIK